MIPATVCIIHVHKTARNFPTVKD